MTYTVPCDLPKTPATIEMVFKHGIKVAIPSAVKWLAARLKRSKSYFIEANLSYGFIPLNPS